MCSSIDQELYPYDIVAVWIYRLVMKSIDLSKTPHFEHCQSETNYFPTIFFLTKFFFSDFFSDRILSQTEFCLGLIFYFRLHTPVVFRMQSSSFPIITYK